MRPATAFVEARMLRRRMWERGWSCQYLMLSGYVSKATHGRDEDSDDIDEIEDCDHTAT
jgi:hypothetical protein